MDLNAGYSWSHWPCCFSMIRTEGPEALVSIGQGVAICQHHLYMASGEAPTGRPRGGEMVKVGGPAAERYRRYPVAIL